MEVIKFLGFVLVAVVLHAAHIGFVTFILPQIH